MRKQPRWPMLTAGSSILMPHFQRRLLKRTSLTSNSSQRLSQTSAQILISLRHLPSSPPRCLRRLLTLLNWWSSRKKSIDCSEPTHSTLPSASCIKNLLRDSTPSSEIFRCQQERPQSSPMRSKCAWFRDQRSPRMRNAWSSTARNLRFVHFIKRWTLAALWTADHQWSVWFSPVSKIKSRCSRSSRRKRNLSAPRLLNMSSAVSLRRWSRLRLVNAMLATGIFDSFTHLLIISQYLYQN